MNCCLDNSHGILLYYKHITWDRKSILCVVDIFWNHFTVYMFKSVKCLFISLVGWSMIVGRDCSCILSSYGTVVRGEHPAVLYVTLSQALISVSFPLKTQFWNVSPGITPVWSLMLRLSLLFSVGLFNVRHIWTNQSSVGAVTEKKNEEKKITLNVLWCLKILILQEWSCWLVLWFSQVGFLIDCRYYQGTKMQVVRYTVAVITCPQTCGGRRLVHRGPVRHRISHRVML